MDNINTKNIDIIINKMKKMLNEKELGVKIDFGGARYDSDSFKVNIKVSLPNAKTDEEKNLEALMKMRNANPKYYRPLDLTKIVKIKNVDYSLVGYRKKATKQPFIVLNLLNKKQYSMTEEQVDRLFGDLTWIETKSEYEVANA